MIDNVTFGGFVRTLRKEKQMTQLELAKILNLSDKTISKWERGLSVPDSDLLIALAEVLETPVSTLLGETVGEEKETAIDDMKELAKKLEAINLQLAQRKARRRSGLRWLLILLCAAVVAAFITLLLLHSPYLKWDYAAPETAVIGVTFHALEWLFIRLAPMILAGAIAGILLLHRTV